MEAQRYCHSPIPVSEDPARSPAQPGRVSLRTDGGGPPGGPANLTPHQRILTLRTAAVSLALTVLGCLGCSAAGLELQNYGFFGAIPQPDGARLRPLDVVEKVSWTAGADTLSRFDGEFRIDTVRIDGNRVWLLSRTTQDNQGRTVVDSAWLDRYTLRTIRSIRHDHKGRTEIEINRRSVKSRRTTPNGGEQGWHGLHDAAPYGLIGIEVVMGALPMRMGAGGSIAVVDGLGDRLQWLHYSVVDQTQEPRTVGSAVSFKPVWMVEAMMDGRTLYFWVDAEERAVVRRAIPGPDETRMLVLRGGRIPRINLFPVEPIGGGLPRDRSPGVIGQGTASTSMGGSRR